MNKLFDYSPIIGRPPLKWPDGKKLAFYLGLNIEHYDIDKPATSIFGGTAHLVPDPLNYGWRDYSPRVGVWRIMEILDQFKMRASVLLNSDVCHYYPEIIKEGNKRLWAWLAHGKTNSRLQANFSKYDEEFAFLKEVVGTIEKSTGKRPQGWLGPALTETFNTPEILAALGLSYILDWCNDDQPYALKVNNGGMISVPYSIEINDIPLFVGKNLSGEDFYQIIKDQLGVLYEESKESGRVMCLAIHPFVIGQPFRINYLKRALEYIASHQDVWLTTSDEIAQWYLEKYV